MTESRLQSCIANLPPEARLVICCARRQRDEGVAEQMDDLIQQDLNWDQLLGYALDHRLQPLLYRHLQAFCPRGVPPTVMARLRAGYHFNVQRNLYLTGELFKVLDQFEAAGIGAIPYKGPVLAAMLYDDLSLRQFGDLDILIRPAALLLAQTILENRGYQPLEMYDPGFDPANPQRSTIHHLGFVHRADPGRRVELHWRVTKPHRSAPLDFDFFRDRLQAVCLAGVPVPTFSPTDLLLILAVHGGAHHRWDRLSWLCDLAELLRQNSDLDWDWIRAQAETLTCRRPLALSLILARELLVAPLPPQIAVWIDRDRIAASLAKRVVEWLFSGSEIALSRLDNFDFFLEAEGNRWARAQFYRRQLQVKLSPNQRDRAFVHLPHSLSFLYCIIRPLRLLYDYGRGFQALNYLYRTTLRDLRDGW